MEQTWNINTRKEIVYHEHKFEDNKYSNVIYYHQPELFLYGFAQFSINTVKDLIQR